MIATEGASWNVDTLVTLCAHGDEGVRAWAVGRLGLLRDAAAMPALAACLEDASPTVVARALSSLRALGDAELSEAARDALRKVMRNATLPRETSTSARTLLIERGDAEAVAETASLCLRGDSAGDPWFELARVDPARFRDTASELERLAPSPSMIARAVIRAPRVARIEEVPEAYGNLAALSSPEDRATFAWELLRRCRADHLFPRTEQTPGFYADLIDDQGAAYLYEVDEPHVQRWLSPAEFGPLLDALGGQRWAEAIAWCAWWCDDVGGDDVGAAWTRTVLQLLGEESAPEELHARVAACLAVAAGERAIEREHRFAECDIEEQFARACGCADELEAERRGVILSRWKDLRDDEDARAELTDAFETVLDTRGPRAREAALALASEMPRFPLPSRALALPEDGVEGYRPKLIACLAANTPSLRALAPSALDDDDCVTKPEVLAALASQQGAWAGELLRERFESLAAGPHREALLDAVKTLGDTSLLPLAVAAWRDGDLSAAAAAAHLARLAGSDAELPAALLRDASLRAELRPKALDVTSAPKGNTVALDVVRGGALTVDLTCNRCGRVSPHDPGGAVVHPDLVACAGDGWDGVVFERVITCPHCGAEDDYSLGPTARRAIAVCRLGAMQHGRAGARVLVGIPSLSDGTPIRRASDGLRHWRSRLEADPNDAEGWLRLGHLYKIHRRIEQSIDAYRRSISFRPRDLEAPGALLQTLLEEGRVHEGPDLPEVILKALPTAPSLDARLMYAELVTEALRVAGEGGQPLGFTASWPSRAQGGVEQKVGAVDLRRVTRWWRLSAFIAHPAVHSMGVKIAHPDDAESELRTIVEGDGPVDASFAVTPSATSQPPRRASREPEALTGSHAQKGGARIGRNDPCFCGSGKKYKRCHGA
ncbi:MAG: SEC-C metal-binding domain-containing protein [Polyangiales bacterium]